MGKMARFYSKESDVVIFNDIEPVKLQGWKEFKDAEERIMDGFSRWKVAPKDLKLMDWGDVVLTTATPVLDAVLKDGKTYNLTLRHTAVWERRGNVWLIVHDHWSIPWPSS